MKEIIEDDEIEGYEYPDEVEDELNDARRFGYDDVPVVEDPTEIKARLMKLVNKGQKELEQEEENRRKKGKTIEHNTLHKAKDDAEMYEKSYL